MEYGARPSGGESSESWDPHVGRQDEQSPDAEDKDQTSGEKTPGSEVIRTQRQIDIAFWFAIDVMCARCARRTGRPWLKVLFFLMSGRTWVTRMPGEEHSKDCLVPVFPKPQTVLVWACFHGGINGLLIIWNKENWGTTVKSRFFTTHIVSSFH